MGSGDQVTIPAAIEEMVIRYFGNGEYPSYARTPHILQRNPYRRVRERFSRLSDVLDVTSIDSDLGPVIVFPGRSDKATVRLSLVGPFALVTGEAGQPINPPDLTDILVQECFQILDRDILERVVEYWSPVFEGVLYELLFEFDQGLPWAR